MRTTLILDDKLLKEAAELTGESQKTRLVHMGLKELIHRAASQRLAEMGGMDPKAKAAPRRKLKNWY